MPYKKLFRWGWFTVKVAFGWFVLNTGLTVLVQLLQQYNVQVLAVVVSGLTGRAASGQGAGNAASEAGGFLQSLLPSDVEAAVILFAILAVGIIVLKLVDKLLESWTDNTMLARLQILLHDKLLGLGPGYHQQHDVSETTLTVTRYAAGTQMILRDLISSPVTRGISLTTALIFLINNVGAVGGESVPLWIQFLLIAALFVLPLGGWWLSGRVRLAFQKVRDSESAMANEFTNSASLPLEVQLMGANRQRSHAFGAKVMEFAGNRIRATLRKELATQFQATTPLILQTTFLIYGVFVALKSGNPAAAGSILAIYYFVPQAVQPIQEIIQFINGLNSTWPQVEKVVEILEAEPEVVETADARLLTADDRELALEDVVFAYAPQGALILDHCSHVFATGKTTAIVGRAGTGKSTILNLAARIRDPQSGVVRLGGHDLRHVSLASLRGQVVKVSQFPLFLADTVRANFLLAKADAADKEIEEACRRTGLWSVLENAVGGHGNPLDYRLPRQVSEGLSGGQRRLLAVTRALLLRPTVLLLDEPTTGIDALGRKMLVQILRESCQDITVLLVDHDMDFVTQTADVICCLEEGRFSDVGSPQELIGRQNLFRSLIEAANEEKSSGERSS